MATSSLLPTDYTVKVDISVGSIVMLAAAAIAVITFAKIMR